MRWHWAVPGPLAQYTGGYRYDAEVVSGLRARGVALDVHALAGRHPDADGSAQVAAAHTWTGSAAAGAGLIIDGLALPAFAPLLARSDPRGPVIALIHHPLALETGLDPDRARHLAQAEHAALSRVDAVVVTSAATRALLAGGELDAARLHVARPGTARVTRRLPKRPRPGPVRLLCVATLTPRKGHLRLLAALSGVRQVAWQLVCVGGDRGDQLYARRIRARRDRAGWRRRVRITGEVDPAALSRHYHEADLFVSASRLEGYGMALAEALMHGLPIVTTRGGAIAQTVPPTAGLRIHGAAPRHLRRALSQAMEQPGRRRHWTKQARRQARRLGGWCETTAVFEQAMCNAVARSTRHE